LGPRPVGEGMLVRDAMTERLVTAPIDSDLDDVVARMLDERVGSVLLVDEETLVGIITETDVLHAGHVTGQPFDDLPARKVMSQPLVTIGPDETLRHAVQRMESEQVKKLPVATAPDEPVGILTMTDITFNYHEVIREAHQAEDMRSLWESDRNLDDDWLSDL
jgi:CBS domain-containing protein